MSKDNRSPINPFTNKKHYDVIDDDKFLSECYESYYNELRNYEVLDETPLGKQVFDITSKLINTVEDYLKRIGRYDYVEEYYDWEVHLVSSDIQNACCYPGGKIIVYSGITSIMQSEEELAFVLSHEVSHALLDHSRTSASVQQTQNTLSQASWMGSFALDLLGFENAGNLARAAINISDIGSHYFLTKPWGRDHELEADKLGLTIAYLAGFDISIVPDFWQRFTNGDFNDFDFFSTHPSDEKRIAVMRESLISIYNDNDFYSKPLLAETPSAKNEFKNGNFQNNPMLQQQFNQSLTSNQPSQASLTSNSTPHKNNKICVNCGASVEVNDKFCIQCGYNLNSLKCSVCGGEVQEEDAFCIHCGNELK